MMSIGVGGTWRTYTPSVGVGGSWKTVTGAWIGVGGAWKSLTTAPMSALAGPTTVTGSAHSSSGIRVNTVSGSTTVTVTGGVGPFTHSWIIFFNAGPSTDASGTCSVTAPTSATTTFISQTCNGLNSPGADYYIAIDTVTDTGTGA